MNFEALKKYNSWLFNETDPALLAELESIKGNNSEIESRFGADLVFGTGGLRGVLGAGTDRMNIRSVGRATQGLASYLNANFANPSCAIGYDSRHFSEEFAKTSACILAANGVRVWIYPSLRPTPMLSFAVRRLHCSSGIVITASHNPSQYNGYKCYDSNGYQMTDEAAAETFGYIKAVDPYKDVRTMGFEEGIVAGLISYIGEEIDNDFYNAVLGLRLDPELPERSDLKIIYTPLNGAGSIPVRRIFSDMGFPADNVRVVLSQEKPNGDFPTCPYPNPEIRQVFEEAFAMTADFPADLIVATDPDCDRVGLAVRLPDGTYSLLTGNETGCLLVDYILSRRAELGTLPQSPIVVKTIVTTPLISAITAAHGGVIYDLLTGFKYIGELITTLEKAAEANRFVFGLEESYGYLTGAHVRDKDAVNASMLAAEMAAYYKERGIDLRERMEQLYEQYGMYLCTQQNYFFEGDNAMARMQAVMSSLRANLPSEVAGLQVVSVADYLESTYKDLAAGTVTEITLPKSNVISLGLPGGSKVIIRPSGTEPKVKAYITAHCADREDAGVLTDLIAADTKKILGIE